MKKVKKNNTRSLYFPERMLDAFDEVFEYPLTVVEAPMGYGKTTFVREYLSGKNTKVLWLKVLDDSVEHFWTGICHLIKELDETSSEDLKQLGFPNDTVSRQEAWRILASIELTEETVLVVDDYHVVANKELNTFVEFLVHHEMPNFNIVLTLRYHDFQHLDEMMLKGYLNHITKEVFEFTSKDIKAYYKLCGVALKEEELQRLYEMTEGWISALYLLLLNYLEEGTFTEVSNIYRLVEKAVYMPFSDDIKRLLLKVSLFETFTLEQAAFIWQSPNVEALLKEVTDKNALIKYDSRTRTYQIHNLFTKMLKENFSTCEPSYQKRICERAAQWFLQSNDYEMAIQYFYLADELDQVLTVIELDRGNCICSERRQTFIHYFETCPYEIKRNHPVALLIYAMSLFTFNEIELFGKVCGEFVEVVQTSENLDVETRNKLLGEFELLQCFTGYNDIWQMLVHIQRASALLKEPASFIDTSEGWTFGSPSVLYMFYRESGKLEQEIDSIKIALPFYSRVTGGHGVGGDLAMKAEWYFQHGDLVSAEITAYETIQQAGTIDQGDVVLCGKFLLAQIALFKGELEQVQYMIQDMHAYVEYQKKYVLRHTLELCEAFLNLGMKKDDRVPEWIADGDFESSRLYFPARAFMNIVYGKSLIEKKEFHQLLGLTELFMGISSVFPNLLGQIYTYIYLAVANEQIFRHDDALASLKQALDIAMQDKVYMPFVENGEYLDALLRDLSRQSLYIEDIAKIRNLYAAYSQSLAKIHQMNTEETRPALSDRESEIAGLAAEGYSNKEIADRLFISQNTVKTQLKSVFQKLDINSRVLLKQYMEESN